MVDSRCTSQYRVCHYSIRFTCCSVLWCTWRTDILREKSSNPNNGSHLLYGWRGENGCMEIYGYPDYCYWSNDSEWYASLVFDFSFYESPPDFFHHIGTHHIPRSTRYREERAVQCTPFSRVSRCRIWTPRVYGVSELTQSVGATFWTAEGSRFARICEYYFPVLFCSPPPPQGREHARRGHETHPRDRSIQCKKIKSYSSSERTTKLLVSWTWSRVS